jgi:putative endonuclease
MYTGVTGNLKRRLAQHRLGLPLGFPSRYRIFRMVHCEVFSDDRSAGSREKEIKAWWREKQILMIEAQNRTGKT